MARQKLHSWRLSAAVGTASSRSPSKTTGTPRTASLPFAKGGISTARRRLVMSLQAHFDHTLVIFGRAFDVEAKFAAHRLHVMIFH